MPLIDPRVFAPFQSRADHCRDASGMREHPECVVLGVVEGVEPSERPPVRIFLGTEPAHQRAERIFVWSIARVRDPSRVYEIHLMKELAGGFDRRRWLTGFTNYRYAVPHLAGARGLAIFNDVDEIYLCDPAELFDTPMAGHGFLTVPRLGEKRATDTSVMLIDCERMAEAWPLEAAKREVGKRLLARSEAAHPGLRGDLAPEWNARDAEYTEGKSKLIHYTILHTQPWQPLPHVFVYQRNPVGRVWYDLERAADEAGFQIFTRDQPSKRYGELMAEWGGAPVVRAARPTAHEGLESALSEAGAESVLVVGLGTAEGAPPCGSAPRISRHDLASAAAPFWPEGQFDAVACQGLLEYLPEEDIPWVIGELFLHARRLVHVNVVDRGQQETLSDRRVLTSRARGVIWWRRLFESAAVRHPGVRFELRVAESGGSGWVRRRVCRGGPRATGAPRTWALRDGVAAHDRQTLALAGALGFAYEEKRLGTKIGLQPPWPDLVIATGERAVRAAREIGERSEGETQVVQIGRGGGGLAEPFDILVGPGAAGRPPEARRIETTYLHARTPVRLSLRARLDRWVAARALAEPLNRRGTVRPQQGLEYVCARLVEAGVVPPDNGNGVSHDLRIEEQTRREAEQVAARIRELLGADSSMRART